VDGWSILPPTQAVSDEKRDGKVNKTFLLQSVRKATRGESDPDKPAFSLRKFPEVCRVFQVFDKVVDLRAHEGRSQSSIINRSMQEKLLRLGIKVKKRWIDFSIGGHQGFPLGRGY
jgi:hypothetical protein